MFTVKLMRGGRTVVHGCNSYVKNTGGPWWIELRQQASDLKIELQAGDNVYIENAHGKTCDVIKVPK